VTHVCASGILTRVKWVRGVITVLLAVVVGAAACILFWRGPKEPVYHGKTLSEWINTYNNPLNPTVYDLFPKKLPAPTDAGYRFQPVGERNKREAEKLERQRREAADAVRQLGTNAVPILLHWLDADVPAWKSRLAPIWYKLPQKFRGGHFVDWWLIAGDHYRVDRALRGFVILGSEASSAVPELTRRMNTRTSQSAQWAIMALGNIGAEALPPMLAALTDTNALNRPFVARSMYGVLQDIGTNAPTAIQILANCVSDPETGVATWSAITLGVRASEPDIAVPALTRGLGDPRPQVRQTSADALRHFTTAALPAVPALLAGLNDSNAFVRTSMTNALQQISPETLQRLTKVETP